MILGMGIDMTDVNRMKEKLARDNGFRTYVFSEAEIAYCEKQARPEEHYAGRFAAREALLKALGTGLTSPVALTQLEVVHNEQGKPDFRLLASTLAELGIRENTRIHLSLAHERDQAIAMVILESGIA
jgi:holo-[acyl-carrier protein] synthase